MAVGEQEQAAGVLVDLLFETTLDELLSHAELPRHIEVVFAQLQEAAKELRRDGVVLAFEIECDLALTRGGQLKVD